MTDVAEETSSQYKSNPNKAYMEPLGSTSQMQNQSNKKVAHNYFSMYHYKRFYGSDLKCWPRYFMFFYKVQVAAA
jgi:hypothetical protein